MKILKFKKISNEKYKVYLDNGDVLPLFEDVIINNKLLITKEIRDDMYNKLLKQNNEIHAYNMALKHISIRMRSIKEVREYLKRKDVCDELIDIIILKLQKQDYLNDFNFAKAYTNDQLILSNKGPQKIKNELMALGVSYDVIREVSEEIDENILKEKLSNLIEKQIKIKKGSANLVKSKIINYFTNLGYEKSMIINELSKYNLKSDMDKLNKEYIKLYNKYKSKYEGEKLSYFISQKLYMKGYTSSDISKIQKKI